MLTVTEMPEADVLEDASPIICNEECVMIMIMAKVNDIIFFCIIYVSPCADAKTIFTQCIIVNLISQYVYLQFAINLQSKKQQR